MAGKKMGIEIAPISTVWKNSIAVVQTAAAPPIWGRTIRVNSGWTKTATMRW